MAMLVGDPCFADELLELRKERGLDRFDEVWEGMYVMHALPNDEHQKVVNRLSIALTYIVEEAGFGEVRPGVNLAADATDWKNDYRCPDVVVFLNDSDAECHGAFWTGGPALAIEVLSPDDQARKKMDFYAKVGTRELLFVDRDPWALELYRHDARDLQLAGVAELDGPAIDCKALPVTFRLFSGEEHPQIVVTHPDSGREWKV